MTTRLKITMKCPACGAAELVHDTRDMSYAYKGESTTLPAVDGDFCPECGEAVLDAEESRRVNILMRKLNLQVNAAIGSKYHYY
jgi:HTH-type transcriptional regulator / antitoxin MqsA